MERGIVRRPLQRPMEGHPAIADLSKARQRRGTLQPRADQHQIGRAGRQQCDRERDMHSLAGCFEGRSHGMKTSGDSTRGVSRIIFCGIQDSFTTQAPSRHIWTRDSADPSIAREPPVAGWKPGLARRVEVFSREVIRCPMHCSAMTPS
jgi:hypothetical protein